MKNHWSGCGEAQLNSSMLYGTTTMRTTKKKNLKFLEFQEGDDEYTDSTFGWSTYGWSGPEVL